MRVPALFLFFVLLSQAFATACFALSKMRLVGVVKSSGIVSIPHTTSPSLRIAMSAQVWVTVRCTFALAKSKRCAVYLCAYVDLDFSCNFSEHRRELGHSASELEMARI